MLIYISVLVIILLAVIGAILSFMGSYRKIAMLRLLDHSAIESFERITRDARYAKSVDTANSVLSTNPGVLTLIAQQGAVSTTTKFYVQNNLLKVDVNGAYVGPLTTSGVSVASLIFYKFTSAYSTAIKIDMALQVTFGGQTLLKNYHTSVVLRGR